MAEDRITLSVEDGAPVDVARAATALARELTREGVPVARAGGPGPTGSKSGSAIAIGSLVLSGAVSAQIVRSITQVVLGAMRRGLAGRIKLQDGDRKIEIENSSRETERALVEWLTGSSTATPDRE
jgi:hypothetical protein